MTMKMTPKANRVSRPQRSDAAIPIDVRYVMEIAASLRSSQ